jgi:hypothetical protein
MYDPWHGCGLTQLALRTALALLVLVVVWGCAALVEPSSWTQVVRVVLLVWGGLVTGVAATGLFADLAVLRPGWVALTVGAYTALAVPGLLVGTGRVIEALGPVVALTLIAHLGRRDLRRAMRDWALVMALALFASVGTLAMDLILEATGPVPFFLVVLMPPLLLEALSPGLRRLAPLGRARPARLTALVLATLVASGVTVSLLNPITPPVWRALFFIVVAVPIGAALLVYVLTAPAGPVHTPHDGIGRRLLRHMGGALVGLSHGAMAVSLAMYIPLRLLGMGR